MSKRFLTQAERAKINARNAAKKLAQGKKLRRPGLTLSVAVGRPTIKLSDMEKALIETRGRVTKAAEMVGISYTTLSRAINTYPYLRQVLNEARERQIDFTEEQLFKKIENGDTTSILFYLKCQAKHRGYVERTEVAGVRDQPISISIIPAMGKADVIEVTPVIMNDDCSVIQDNKEEEIQLVED